MTIKSLSISGLLNLNLHSLNNEGAEGNYMQTREVQVVDKEGNVQAVNAISGDMFKHIQAEHLFNIAREEGLPLCKACSVFNANRIVGDPEFVASFPDGTSEEEILTGAIKRCILDDTEGILITNNIGGKKRAIGRKSVVEFGWVVGRPTTTRTDSFFHVKYSSDRGKGSGDESGANTGQNIFHRPASSGQYAVVLNLDLQRVGWNDISMEYVIDEGQRAARVNALLRSVLYTLVKPTGAMRNTQNPHIVDFQGAISISNSSLPAPLVSPLNEDYLAELQVITKNLLQFGEGLKLQEFTSLADFTSVLQGVMENV